MRIIEESIKDARVGKFPPPKLVEAWILSANLAVNMSITPPNYLQPSLVDWLLAVAEAVVEGE